MSSTALRAARVGWCASPGKRMLWRLLEPVEFVMERRMLRTLMANAERSSPQTATAPSHS